MCSNCNENKIIPINIVNAYSDTSLNVKKKYIFMR